MPRAVSRLVLVAMLLSSAVSVRAQDDRPRLTLHTKGPAAAIRALEFSRDSGRLFVAGEDKVVHVYTLEDRARRPLRAILARTLRTEFARGLRGALFDIALSPRDDDVAIGGYGARDLGGVITVLDSGDASVQRSLPDWNGANFVEKVHEASIVGLEYAPDGRLASVSKDGEIRIWSAAKRAISTHVRPPGGGEEMHQPILFLDDRTLVAAERTPNSEDWRLALYVDGKRSQRPLTGHRGRITALAMNPERTRWASADEHGRIALWTNAPRPSGAWLRDSGRDVLDLAFGPHGRLAAACLDDDAADDDVTGVLEYWDVDDRELLDSMTTADGFGLGCCAISPDGRFLATQSADDHRVFVYRTRNGDQRIDTPFRSQRNPLTLAGRGRAIGRVAFATDGSRRIAYGFSRTTPAGGEPTIPLEHVFDLKQGRDSDTLPENVTWREPTDGAPGWRAVLADDRLSVVLSERGQPRGRVVLDRDTQGRATCLCFLHDAAGQAVAIAVGTEEQHGIYVHALPDADVRAPLLRYYRDHTGAVRSLSASPDGQLLVSGSDDQLLKIWSLSGLGQASETFAPAAGWGASFVVRNGELVVEAVDPAGIAHARNLRNGDVMTSVTTRPIGAPAPVEVVQPEAMRLALERLELVQASRIEARRGNVAQPPVVVVPGWEPLVSVFVDRQGNWAMFSPLGEYDSSVAEGNEFFGWQVNRGPNTTPLVFAAAELQQEFEKPEVIRKLISDGRPPEGAGTDRLATVIRRVPEVQLVQPRTSTVGLAGQPLPVVARVRFKDEQQREQFVVRAFVNGIPLGEPQVSVGERDTRFEWRTESPDPICEFKVLVEDRRGGPNALVKWDEVAIRTEAAPPRYRLHLLAMAVDDYPETGSFRSLNYATKDVDSVVAKLQATQGVFFDVARVDRLVHPALTRRTAAKLIDDTRRRMANADSRDLLVLYLAGHGYAHGPEYYFVPGTVDSHDQSVLERSAIPWHVLQGLRDIPCRKVVVLDTCFAGNIALAANDGGERGLVKAASQPFDRYGFLVVMATDADQPAKEGLNFGGHGAFTQSLLHGLDGLADLGETGDQDGIVSMYELVEFCRSNVVIRTNAAQRPVFMPLDRFLAIDPVRLVRRGESSDGAP